MLCDDPVDVGNLIPCSSAFSKSSLNIWTPVLLGGNGRSASKVTKNLETFFNLFLTSMSGNKGIIVGDREGKEGKGNFNSFSFYRNLHQYWLHWYVMLD